MQGWGLAPHTITRTHTNTHTKKKSVRLYMHTCTHIRRPVRLGIISQVRPWKAWNNFSYSFFFFFFKHPVYIYDLTVMTDLPNSSTIYDALTTCAYVGLGLYPCLPPYLVSICVTLFKRLSYPTVILRKKVNVWLLKNFLLFFSSQDRQEGIDRARGRDNDNLFARGEKRGGRDL